MTFYIRFVFFAGGNGRRGKKKTSTTTTTTTVQRTKRILFTSYRRTSPARRTVGVIYACRPFATAETPSNNRSSGQRVTTRDRRRPLPAPEPKRSVDDDDGLRVFMRAYPKISSRTRWRDVGAPRRPRGDRAVCTSANTGVRPPLARSAGSGPTISGEITQSAATTTTIRAFSRTNRPSGPQRSTAAGFCFLHAVFLIISRPCPVVPTTRVSRDVFRPVIRGSV